MEQNNTVIEQIITIATFLEIKNRKELVDCGGIEKEVFIDGPFLFPKAAVPVVIDGEGCIGTMYVTQLEMLPQFGKTRIRFVMTELEPNNEKAETYYKAYKYIQQDTLDIAKSAN